MRFFSTDQLSTSFLTTGLVLMGVGMIALGSVYVPRWYNDYTLRNTARDHSGDEIN